MWRFDRLERQLIGTWALSDPVLMACRDYRAVFDLDLAMLSLTGVSNRRYFEQRFGEEVSHAQRHQEPLACMLLDVDRFKKINDTHGHPGGDQVLRDLAKLIKSQVRTGDLVARYGGEEFIVLLRSPSASARPPPSTCSACPKGNSGR